MLKRILVILETNHQKKNYNNMKVTICVLQQEFSMEVGVRESVMEIKAKIEEFLGIPIATQTLSVSDWELLDGLDMEDYPIVSEGTKINLEINHIETKIHILVKLSSRQRVMSVETKETVRSLKEKIHVLEGIPVKRMSLSFGGRELEDETRCLREYGITREMSEVVVVVVFGEPSSRVVSFVVQTPSTSLLSGAGIPVQASDSSSVSDLRRSLLTRKMLPLDDYLFVHKQRVMRDGFSLKWHGVEDGDFLFVFKGTVSPGKF